MATVDDWLCSDCDVFGQEVCIAGTSGGSTKSSGRAAAGIKVSEGVDHGLGISGKRGVGRAPAGKPIVL